MFHKLSWHLNVAGVLFVQYVNAVRVYNKYLNMPLLSRFNDRLIDVGIVKAITDDHQTDSPRQVMPEL